MIDPADTRFTAEAEDSIWKKAPLWRTAPADAILLLALLLTANWFLSRADPGWQRLNPTPWLLLPILLGGRYGTGAGMLGALAALAGVAALQWAAENQTPLSMLASRPYFFLSLLLGGALGAIIHHLAAGPAEQLRTRALGLAERNRRLEEDAALHRANEARLVDSLLLHGAESVSLSGALQRLFKVEQGRFEENLLSLMEREFGVISAAVYRDENGGHRSMPLVAVTSVGSSNFPVQIPSIDAPLADAAMAGQRLTTWQSGDSNPGLPDAPGQRHLAAIPWRWSPVSGGGPSALLLIGRMEFSRIEWDNLNCIQAVFAWCMARMRPATLVQAGESPESGRILSPEAFLVRIEEARDLESRLGISFRLILFSADASASQSILADFVERLKSIAAPTDAIGAVGDGKSAPYSIGLITAAPTTFAADQIARGILKRIGASSHAVHLEVMPLGGSQSPLPAGQYSIENPPPPAASAVPAPV